MSNDLRDPHEVLEELHKAWVEASEATEAAWESLCADRLNQSLRNDYYAKQEAANGACQAVLAYRQKAGI
jgi:hypothetical protein